MPNETNDTSVLPTDECVVMPLVVVPVYLFVFVIITLFAILGNGIVIAAIFHNRAMRNTVFQLLLGLSISNLLFSLMSPLHARNTIYRGIWDLSPLGDDGCRVYYFLFRFFYAFSILIMVVIAVDRYRMITLKSSLTKRHGPKKVVAATVTLSALCSAPIVLPAGLDSSDIKGCSQACVMKYWHDWIKIYFVLIYTVLYLIPLVTLFILYAVIWRVLSRPTKSQLPPRKTAHRRAMASMLTTIVVSFFVCWTPYCALEAIVILKYPNITSMTYEAIMTYTLLLVYATGAINPFLYGFFSLEVRKSVRSLFTSCLGWPSE